MSDIRDYQVDHLLLLVGTNPLPNAVAGKLLTTTGGTITLIYSAGTGSLALNLQSWFDNAGYSVSLPRPVDESNATSVYQRVEEVLSNYGNADGVRVGLNYTGGTKVMAVQAHHALENWAKDHGKNAVFSYLDAGTLQMCFDSTPGRPAISFYVGLDVNIKIDELLGLHGWKTLQSPPVTVPVLPESAAALLAVNGNASDASVWTDWLHKELFPNARRRVTVKPPFWVSQSGKELQGQYKVEQPASDDKWKSPTDLGKLAIPWPDLPALKEAMSNELGQAGAQNLSLTVKTMASKKKEEAFCNWLNGIWLESAVLSVLQKSSEDLYLKHCCMNLKPKAPQDQDKLFEFDVVAIRGYQLFAFSCTTDDSKRLLKQKLFEAYIRARQMGGDEACTALVCCAPPETVDKLEAEIRGDIGSEARIRIFGHKDMGDLAEKIGNWVRKQSREI